MHPDQSPFTEMTAAAVAGIYSDLQAQGIEIRIDGGWSVDALLGRQLRPHKDLDIAIRQDDVARLRGFLAARGYRQVREDNCWNFVLADDYSHEIDVHAYVCDEAGNITDGIMYPPESLTGSGHIGNLPVRCISPEYMVAFLAPWIHKWPEKYLPAVAALCEAFALPLPPEYTAALSGTCLP